MIECFRMTAASRADARTLLLSFLSQDEHYLDSSPAYGACGEAALDSALDLLLSKPELGFVWLACEDSQPAAVCVVCFAVSTSIGAVVAKLDDVFVAAGKRGRGIGAAHLAALKEELRRIGVRRIDTSVHLENDRARRFYAQHGFRPLREERLAYLL
jgi:GNAT superfamily N-acetyltransferase